MLAQATRTIGDRLRAFRVICAHAVAPIRGVSPAAVLTFALALAWLSATGWWNYVRPQEFDAKAFERYQEEVANCRELRTSEARYDCVVKAMIRRDHVNFGTAMLVFLPPILLVFGHYIWREVRTNMREREHARLAEQRSRQQLSRFRREMIEERAAARATRALLEEEARQRRLYDPQASRAPSHGAAAHPAMPAEPKSKRA